jgi:sodium/proline symporter
MLAGIFAATMSTADSQLLVCSAAITQDIFPQWATRYWAAKIATVGATVLALVVALNADDGVFSLVLGAWGILGAAFGPLVIVRAFGQRPTSRLSISMLIGGAATVVAWRAAPFASLTYELLPGMLVPLGIFFAAKFASGRG